jgi:DNA polymerase type B, organellar and viral
MTTNQVKQLPVAIRVYPEMQRETVSDRPRKPWNLPKAMLVLDTETRIDETQRLTFGSYRFIVLGRTVEEGLFYADDLPVAERNILRQYVADQRADVVREGIQGIKLMSRSEFLERFFRAAYKGRCLVVGFNLPFDLSRVAWGFSAARGKFAGGFSLRMWSYVGKDGVERSDQHRPGIGIKHIDSKRALKGFTSRNKPDQSDLIPDDSATGEPEKGYKFRGYFLDLRTLSFVLTDRGHSLESACKAFNVEHGKQSTDAHGEINREYIDYNRRDVQATAELASKLIEEYEKHPISLPIIQAYSPASTGKAYLRAMGIEPILKRQPDFPKEYLGYAATAFFGGRTSAHIRKVAIPVVYTDFLSMYPTVNVLMGLHRFLIAEEIRIIKDCASEITSFLEDLKPSKLFDPYTWKYLPAFVRVIPNGDILPSRSKYSVESNDWQVGVNYLYGIDDKPENGLWFSLPDVVASVLLTGRIPRIVDAFRLEAVGKVDGLQPLRLRRSVLIDPAIHDFFKTVIEERKRPQKTEVSETELERLDKSLKVFANATSYGIFAEMNQQESDEQVNVLCRGIDLKPYTCRVTHPEKTGEYCFPPVASLITGGARLMLALAEHAVREKGGTYAMEDTDSMAIVATEDGGIIPCPGGTSQIIGDPEGVRALKWKEVEQISDQFKSLNPYDGQIIPGSILKIEDDNFDPHTNRQRQLHCLAISAKRYALFLRNEHGEPVLIRRSVNNKEDRWSKHGLGHLLNPTNLDSSDRDWIAQVWLGIIRRALEFPTSPLDFEKLPAIGRLSVTSPAVMRCLQAFNANKHYSRQIKPFNFLMTCYALAFGHPTGTNPKQFHLVTPYHADSSRWFDCEWIDQYSGEIFGIKVSGGHGTRTKARVKTYGDLLLEYEFHPESKCADSRGNVCTRQTAGLLQRRHVQVGHIKNIGKESNSLDRVESGLIHSESTVYVEYPDRYRDEWRLQLLPELKKAPMNFLVRETGLSRRMIIDARAGRSLPHHHNQETIRLALVKFRKDAA